MDFYDDSLYRGDILSGVNQVSGYNGRASSSSRQRRKRQRKKKKVWKRWAFKLYMRRGVVCVCLLVQYIKPWPEMSLFFLNAKWKLCFLALLWGKCDNAKLKIRVPHVVFNSSLLNHRKKKKKRTWLLTTMTLTSDLTPKKFVWLKTWVSN